MIDSCTVVSFKNTNENIASCHLFLRPAFPHLASEVPSWSLPFALASPSYSRNASNPAPIGASLDFFGFFWAELLSSFSLILLSYRYYQDAQPVVKPDPNAPPAVCLRWWVGRGDNR